MFLGPAKIKMNCYPARLMIGDYISDLDYP
jgi:hypothetical protein